MIGAPEEWRSLLLLCSAVFSEPSYALFARLTTAWVLCPGRHTLTRLYQVAEPSGQKAHDAYHRFFRAGAWSMRLIWKQVAHLLVTTFAPCGVIRLALDDTAFHKSGRKVDGAGWWRDAVRSTGTKVVHCFGLNIVVLTLQVQPPWGGEPLGLPVNIRLHRKGEVTLLDLAEDMVREFAGWFAGRDLELAADGFFASLAGRALPLVSMISRMRRDAAIYAPLPVVNRRRRGRPRKKGRRLPTPEEMAKSRSGWRQTTVTMRGKQKERLVLVRDVVWYVVCPGRAVRLVISRDPSGHEEDDFLFTTHLDASAESVVSSYADRWAIEDTFRNVKQFLGGEDPQCWKAQGPERAAAFSFLVYSAVWAWYIRTHGCRRSWNPLAWYPKKSTPSFADALAALRRVLWAERFFPTSEKRSLPPKMAAAIINILATAA